MLPSEILVTLHLPRGGTMSPGPRRNFRNMGFHFLTPIFQFLSKPKPNEKLVAYSMITHTWTQKTHFDKTSKNFRRQNSKTKLSLSKLNFDKKYWLIFWKFPFSNWHPRSKTRPNIPISLETRTKSKICCLFHDNPHLNSKNPFWQNFKKFSKAKLKNQT